jgi:hypothetical protein
MGDYEIRPFQDEDEASLLETFNLVFSATNPDMPPRTPEQWRWAYRENPGGKRIFVAAHEGQVVAQYAGMPNRMWFEGEERAFVDIVDSMVHPDHRLGLKRPGLFIKTAQPFLEEYGRPDRDLAFFGWPIERAWPINKRFLGYQQIRSEVVLAREPGPGPGDLPDGVERIERFGPEAERLYRRCLDGWGLSGIRDDRFLNWRYVTNPFYRYVCIGVRRSDGELAGYAVYRPSGGNGPALLVDFLAHPDDVHEARQLAEGALALARADGEASIATLQVEWTPWFRRFQEWGWLVWPTEWIMVASIFHPRLDPVWLRDHWWYQMGDLDVV